MNQRALAITILQKAREALGERLTQRIVESEQEIADDAEGGSYLSEIEAIYDQLGGRLAHLNAMLSNLPPASGMAPTDATASEIVYADLASASSPSFDIEANEATAPMTLLALPAPSSFEERTHNDGLLDVFAKIAVQMQSGDLLAASRLISELFDIKPSLARRGAQALARQATSYPELARRMAELSNALDATNDYAAATLLSDSFEFQPIEALAIVTTLKQRLAESENNPS